MDKIDCIINNVIGNLVDQKNGSSNKNIEKKWNTILTEQEKSHTKIKNYKNKKLYIEVDSAAWMYQLNLKKRKICKLLQHEIPEIQNIYFRIGNI